MKQKIKIQKSFVDYGFGFPVVLIDVPMIEVQGKWTPHLNYKKYANGVLEALAHKPARLTGNEIKFIRHKFEMTLQEFAKRFGQKSHQAVMKWEDFGDKPTSMLWTTEKDICLAIMDLIHRPASKFLELYNELKEQRPSSDEKITIEAEKFAA